MSAVAEPRRTRNRVRPTTEEGDQLRHERDHALACVEIERLRTGDQVARVKALQGRLRNTRIALAVLVPAAFLLGWLL